MDEMWSAEWLRRFSTPDPASLIDLYSDDALFEDVTLGQRVSGKTELAAFFGAFMNRAERTNRFTLLRYLGDAKGGASEWMWEARHEGDFLGQPARGKTTSIRGVSVLEFDGGKVREQRDYWDARTLLAQLAAAKG
jgi:steroid delta-isomerase-like uncharacterized protein